jgi:hypothetical protein
MKFRIIAITLLASCGILKAQAPPMTTPEVISEFNWNEADIEPFRQWPLTGGLLNSVGSGFRLGYHGNSPVSLNLRTMGSAIASRITFKHYAILGKVKYSHIPAGSYLEMLSYFDPDKVGGQEQMYFSRTLADSGPMAKLEGTDDGRDFLLPFDATDAKTKLARIVLNLYLTGQGTVDLSDVKLVQYPDALPASDQSSSSSEEEVITELSQKNAFTGVTQDNGEPNVLQIFKSRPLPLWEIKDPKITANHYAIVGEIRYQNVSNGELTMSTEFAPEDPGGSSTWFYTRTEADQGPFARLKGTSDWRPFWLPFDSSKIKNKTRLKRLMISLGLADEGTVYVRNVKLMQYPTETFPPLLAPNGTIPPPQLPSGEPAFQEQNPSAQVPVESPRTTGIDWKSFLLGIAATGASLFVGGGIIFISRRWNRRRHERELRRIASLDS